MAPDMIIGRAAEMGSIERFFDREASGACGLLIEGAAGIGKTTMWREAVRRAERAGSVLTARASEGEAQLAFTVLGDLLVPALDDEALAELPAGQRRGLEVALLLAEHGSTRPDVRAVSLAVLAVLRALARRGLTIGVDDVQWIDASSARALTFALRRLESEPITVVAARRWGTGSNEFIDLVNGLPRVEWLALGSMDEAALGRLLRGRFVRDFPPPLVKRIHGQTGGNPFFAIEVGRALGDAARLLPEEPLPVPRDLEGILRRRVAGLSTAGHDACLLISAAAAPSRDVVAAAGGSADGVQEALDEGIITAHAGTLEFTHPLLGSTVYGCAESEELRHAHARLAEAAFDPEERARHLALSTVGPSDEVATALDEAAAHARDRGAPLAAAELFELAASCTPPTSDRGSYRRLQVAGNLYDAGDADGARHMVERLLGGLESGPSRAAALRALAIMSWNDVRRIVELTSSALEDAGDDEDLRSRILSEMAWAELEACRPLPAVELARASLALAESLPDRVPKRLALSILSTAEAVRGRPAADLINRGVALQDSTAAGETTWPAITHGRLLMWAGDLAAARSVLESALEDQIDQGREAATWEIRVHLAEVEHRAGRWDRASVHASTALEIALDSGRDSVAGEIQAVRAAILATTAHVEDARRDGLEALTRCERYGDRWYELMARSALGSLELSLGDPAAAHAWFAPVAATCRDMGLGDPGVFPFVPDDVQALVTLGELDEAERLTDRLETQGRALDRALALATAGRCRGLIAGARGDLEAAMAELDRALDLHALDEHRFETARTLLTAGEVQRRMKRKRAARELLERATVLFDELGAPTWSARARADLGRIGGRPPSPGGLTPTEVEVARLVARGFTNRETADALFMSADTVKANLKRIYGKLGVRSRTELATRLDVATQDPVRAERANVPARGIPSIGAPTTVEHGASRREGGSRRRIE